MMTYRRRGSARFLAAALMFSPAIVLAQKPVGLPGNYPSKPIRVIVGSAPGAGADTTTRLIAGRISESWGTPLVIENISSGIGGVVALQMIQKAPPDGYTIHNSSASSYQNAIFSHKLPLDVRKTFTPIAQTVNQPLYMAFSLKAPFTTVQELIAYAKKNPDAISYGTGGVGQASHLVGEHMALLGDFKWTMVPYKGTALSVADTIAGRIQVVFGGTASIMPHVTRGALRGIGITSTKRLNLQPDIPTIAEQGLPGVNYDGWQGWVGPAGIPVAIVRALHDGVNQALVDPQTRKALIAGGADPANISSEEFTKNINDGLVLVQSILEKTGIKLAE